MSLTLLLLIAVFAISIIIFKKRQLKGTFNTNNKLIEALKNAKWFQNYWFFGSFLFVINVILFCLTGLVLYVVTYFSIPFIHLLVMVLAVVGSIYFWFLFKNAWHGTKRERLKMAVIGSSCYFILSIIFIYWYVTIEPSYPGEDTFMRALGLMFNILVTSTAFITCFVITGFSNKKLQIHE